MCTCRSPNCIAVRAQKAVILFDCGEDAQRQLMQQPQLGHSRIHRIFVTWNSCLNIYGLPGKQRVFCGSVKVHAGIVINARLLLCIVEL